MNVQSSIDVGNMMEEIALKKKAIFDSALSLIKEHGFHGAPMSQIAKEAGVAAGTIYHYFESKDHLICELYKYNRQQIIEVVKTSLSTDADYKQKFEEMWNKVLSFYKQNPNVLIFFEQYINSPYNVTKQEDDFNDRPLYDFFKEGIEKGIVKDIKPEVLVVMVLGNVISTAKFQMYGKKSLTKKDEVQIISMVWDGITRKQ